MLSCSNIQVTYGKEAVLKNISVSLKPGCLTALVGPSGAGKSTLLRTLAFLENPRHGTITLNDTTYSFPSDKSNPEPSPWPRVTAVFQNLFLWPHLTLRENILLPLRVRGSHDGKKLITRAFSIYIDT